MQVHPEHYAGAFAGALPFKDRIFDFVYSINCITHGLDIEASVFYHAVEEALRVTKPGGELQLFPFLANIPAECLRNHRTLLARYAKYATVETIPSAAKGEPGSNRLRIIKP